MKAVIYARYSTDKQSESSIEDQFRVCRKLAERNDLEIVAEYADRAISGGTANRPEYQRMFTDVRSGRVNVIVAEDSSRLWRNLAEQSTRLAELQDLGVHVITHDLDTRQESAELVGAITGAMGQAYRKEIARRTRRGLEGLAHAKKPTGGRSYGYIAAADSSSGDREIDQTQAPIVVRVFEMYADGMSPRAIAEQLNSEGIPSPGSSWNRTNRRTSGWAMSGIAGDFKRGTGILNNELYVGRVIWNRFRWIRSASDSSKRRCLQNPESEWVVYENPDLRIVPQKLWDRVKQRQRAQSERIGDRVREGLTKASAKSTGRSPRYLFSTLLKCGTCGSSYTIRGRSHFACGRHLDGRACSQKIGVRRDIVEPGLIESIKGELLSEQAIEAAVQAAHRFLNDQNPVQRDPKRVKELRNQIDNLTDAIASGALKSSPALAARLEKAESELDAVESAKPAPEAAKMIPRIADEYRAWVRELETVFSPEGLKQGLVSDRDIARARAQLKKRLGGNIVVRETESEIRFETEAGPEQMALRMAGASQVFMVAGVGFEPTTFGL